MPIEVRNDASPNVVGPAAFQAGLAQFLAQQRAIQQQREDLQAQMAQRERLAAAGMAADERRLAFGHASDLQRMAFGAGLEQQRMAEAARLGEEAKVADFDREMMLGGAEAAAKAAAAAKERADRLRDIEFGIGVDPLKPEIHDPASFRRRKAGFKKRRNALLAAKPSMDPGEFNAAMATLDREEAAVFEEPPKSYTTQDAERGYAKSKVNGIETPMVPDERGNPSIMRGWTPPKTDEEIAAEDWRAFLDWQKTNTKTVETPGENGRMKKETVVGTYDEYLAHKKRSNEDTQKRLAAKRAAEAQQEAEAAGLGPAPPVPPGKGGDVPLHPGSVLQDVMQAPPPQQPMDAAPAQAAPTQAAQAAPPSSLPADPFGEGYGDVTADSQAGPAMPSPVPIGNAPASATEAGPAPIGTAPAEAADGGFMPLGNAPAGAVSGNPWPNQLPEFAQPLGFEFNPTMGASKEEALANRQVAEQYLKPGGMMGTPDDSLENTLSHLESEDGHRSLGIPKAVGQKVQQAIKTELETRQNLAGATRYLDAAKTGEIMNVSRPMLERVLANLPTATMPDEIKRETADIVRNELLRRDRNRMAVEGGKTIPVPEPSEQQAAKDAAERQAILSDMAERENIRSKAVPPPPEKYRPAGNAGPAEKYSAERRSAAAARYQAFIRDKIARMPVIKSTEELAALPTGTMYIDQSGKQQVWVNLKRSLVDEGYISEKDNLSKDQLLQALMKLPLAQTKAQVAAIAPGQLYRTSNNVSQKGVIHAKALNLESPAGE